MLKLSPNLVSGNRPVVGARQDDHLSYVARNGAGTWRLGP